MAEVMTDKEKIALYERALRAIYGMHEIERAKWTLQDAGVWKDEEDE